MRTLLLSTTLLISFAAGALAQSSAPAANTASPSSGTATGSSNPAVSATGNAPTNAGATGRVNVLPLTSLEKGSNSFTEGQAKARLEGAGLSNITDLKKDDKGVWRGKAMLGGKSVTVGFDYKGAIGVQ